jgi:hypothetical protein
MSPKVPKVSALAPKNKRNTGGRAVQRGRPPRVSGGCEATRWDRGPRGDRRTPLGPLRSKVKLFSERQGPWERRILCVSGARTSAPQTPVVTCLGAGEDLQRFIALTARSGQATRRLPQR